MQIRFYKELYHVADYIYNRFGSILASAYYTTRTSRTAYCSFYRIRATTALANDSTWHMTKPSNTKSPEHTSWDYNSCDCG